MSKWDQPCAGNSWSDYHVPFTGPCSYCGLYPPRPGEEDEVLTVDDLKRWVERGGKIHYFGLGFVQVKISSSRRWHFYHPDFRGFVDAPHDHRARFSSKVVRGTLDQVFWVPGKFGEEGPGQFIPYRYDNCTGEDGDVPPGARVWVERVKTRTEEGSSYLMPLGLFHQVIPLLEQGPVVTLIDRGPRVHSFARILDVGDEGVCPFSQRISEEDCWRIVEDCWA